MNEFIELMKVGLIGIVEGITEWLPISSTGHMLLLDEVINLNKGEAFKEMFFVVIQFGAILAVIIIYWQEIFPFDLKKRYSIKPEVISTWLKIIVACIPTGILGILFDDVLEAYFGTSGTIAVMLIFYGILFILIERWNKKRCPAFDSISDIKYRTAFMFGLFQSLAMIPGTSRSGATIMGGLLMGVSRVAAAEFSFILAIPTMLAASAYKLYKFGMVFSSFELIMLLLGMVVAFFVSLVAIRFLMRYIRTNDFSLFGWYRIVLGIVILLLIII